MDRSHRTRPSLVQATTGALGLLVVLSATAGTSVLDFAGRHATVESEPVDQNRVRYVFTTTATDGVSRSRTVEERTDGPRVRTGTAALDASFALAVEDATLDAVDDIVDGQFNGGAPIPCHCYKTGALWPFVWTRDTAYATALGLGLLDPVRLKNALAFKHSRLRLAPSGTSGDDPVVAQDTGSGGSWPISSDRVVWIHAATGLIARLPPAEAATWETEVWRTARATLDEDREYAFDPHVGLYRGETSFLDWREQTYPSWTRNDTRPIAESFSLSTNALHRLALEDAVVLARRAGDAAAAERYALEAEALGRAMERVFWQPSAGLYGAYVFSDLAPVTSYDLLGLALVAEAGLADEARLRTMLEHYPVAPGGPPVVWPEQAATPIYHNRSVWPFVTAYGLRTALAVRDSAAAIDDVASLVHGTLLSHSAQENFEFLTLATRFEDGPLSGPVVNSPRQLWSIAALGDLVIHDLFGVTVDLDGTRIAPRFPAQITGRVPQGGERWTLADLSLGERPTTITLQFPATVLADDWLEAGTISADGVMLGADGRLAAGTTPQHIDVTLVARPAPPSSLRRLKAADPHAPSSAEAALLYAPTPPLIDAVADVRGRVTLALAGIADGNDWQLWRDGRVVAHGRGPRVTDRLPARHGAVCYRLTQTAPGGLTSLPSAEHCLAATVGRIEITAGDPSIRTTGEAHLVTDAPTRYAEWSGASATLTFPFSPTGASRQRLTVGYRNDGRINTGIAAGVLRIHVQCEQTSRDGALVLPQLGDPLRIGRSTAFEFDAPIGAICSATLRDGLNMTQLEHNRLYTAARGGASGPSNQADLLDLVIEPIGTLAPAPPTTR